jgi:glycosyltransferase involved in cell wall biosynthesis
MAHDVRMTGLLRLSMDRRHPFAPALAAGLERLATEGGDDVGGDGHGQLDVEGLGSLLLAEVVSHADQLLVSSEAARGLAEGQVGPELAGRIRVLPFAMALDDAELEIVAVARSQQADALPLLVSFGIVDPAKLPHLLLEATSVLRPDVDVMLAFVGPVSDALALELRERAAQLGMADRVRVTGHLDRSEYLGYLGRATAAVQLRAGFSGEASAAVSDALSAGVVTVVSDLGWMGSLPADTVVKVDTSGDGAGERLAAALRSLLGDPSRRASLSARAADYAATQTFAGAAAALISALDFGREA